MTRTSTVAMRERKEPSGRRRRTGGLRVAVSRARKSAPVAAVCSRKALELKLRSRQDCLVERGQGAVSGGVRGRPPEQRPVMKLELFGLRQICRAERDRGGQVHQYPGAVPPAGHGAGRQHFHQRVGQPRPVRTPAQQHRPGMPDQSLPVSHHRQPTVPP